MIQLYLQKQFWREIKILWIVELYRYTPLLKHGQETKKVQDMRPVLAVSMVYGDTFQKKWKFFHQPFCRKCDFSVSGTL